jgi:hypothetical protein
VVPNKFAALEDLVSEVNINSGWETTLWEYKNISQKESRLIWSEET